MDGEATQFPCCLHAEFPPRLGPGSKESGSFPHYGHGPCSWLFLKEGNNFISKESLKNQQLVQTNGLVPRSSAHPCTLGCCLTSSRGTCRWSELHGVCGSAPTWLGMDAKERDTQRIHKLLLQIPQVMLISATPAPSCCMLAGTCARGYGTSQQHSGLAPRQLGASLCDYLEGGWRIFGRAVLRKPKSLLWEFCRGS